MRGLAGAAALVAVLLGSSVWLGSERASASEARSGAAGRVGLGISAATVRSSRLVLGGRVRCTAIVSSEVQAGQAVQVRFVLHNRSRGVVRVSADSWLVLRAGDGTTYDDPWTSTEPEGGPGFPQSAPSIPTTVPFPVRPGGTMRFSSSSDLVRWKGPIRITPVCLKAALPALRVRVTSPGLPSDASAAVAEVVAASGHLLDQCRPQTPGLPVDGQIDAPNGNAPPMSAQCSVFIGSEGRFWVAQVFVLTPGGPGFVELWPPYETLWQPGLPPPTLRPPYEAIAWQFVVTQDGAIPVAASTMAASYPSEQVLPLWYWSGTGGQYGGTDPCGGSHFFSGTWMTGPAIEFISACPAPAS